VGCPRNRRPTVTPLEHAWSIVELIVFLAIGLAAAWAVARGRASNGAALVFWIALIGIRAARSRGW
jgi:hypothetical protein